MAIKTTSDLRLLKSQLRGSNLKKLLLQKNTTKYRVAKDCGINYRTLAYWQTGTVEPSDECAIIVGKYLGLINLDEVERLELKKEMDALNEKMKRLTNENKTSI